MDEFDLSLITQMQYDMENDDEYQNTNIVVENKIATYHENINAFTHKTAHETMEDAIREECEKMQQHPEDIIGFANTHYPKFFHLLNPKILILTYLKTKTKDSFIKFCEDYDLSKEQILDVIKKKRKMQQK